MTRWCNESSLYKEINKCISHLRLYLTLVGPRSLCTAYKFHKSISSFVIKHKNNSNLQMYVLFWIRNNVHIIILLKYCWKWVKHNKSIKSTILRLFSLCRTQISIISLLYWHVTQLLLHDIQFCDYAFYIT